MSPRARLLIALVSTGVIGYIAVGSVLGRVRGDTTYGQLAIFNEVIRIVLDSYVEPVNLDRTMAGARLGLGDGLDGDSAYLDADQLRAYQNPPKDSDADLGLILSRRFAFLMVVSTRPGSPAEKARIKSGDIIKTIDGRHTRPLTAPLGERLLRGAPGSVVKLTLLRAGSDPIEVSVVREKIAPTSPRGKVLDNGPGYLKVPEFSLRTADDVRGEVESLKRAGARSLILDLRGAGFGLPAEGVKVAELFLKGGMVAKLAGRKSGEQVLTADASRSVWDLPLAVLVDTGTAGPGEIVAAALLDAQRGPLIGERTFGRAAVQKTIALPEGGLVLTVAKYFSPKGNPIHGRGVEPSMPVEPLDDEEAAASPGRDPILEKAIEVLATENKKAA